MRYASWVTRRVSRFTLLAALAGLAVAVAVPAEDLSSRLSPYTHKAWSTRDGLPQMSVLSVIQTSDGYLWLATQEGLARFDGVRFTVYDRSNSPWLPHSGVNALLEARDGSLWIATLGGLVRWHRGAATTFTKAQGLCADNVTAIAEDSAGVVWLATHGGGLGRFANGSFRCIGLTGSEPVRQIEFVHATPSGSVLVGSGRGLHRYRPESGQLERVSGFPPNLDVRAILETSDGRLWAGTQAGLWEYSHGRWWQHREAEGPGTDAVQVLMEDHGLVWAGSEQRGLFQFGPGPTVRRVGADQGLSGSGIRGLHIGREGVLWVGTYTHGLHAMMRSNFRTIAKNDGLPDDDARPIFRARDGSTWIGTRQGLAHLGHGGTTAYTVRDGLCGNDVRTVAEDSSGVIWVGTYEGGVCWIRDGRPVPFPANGSLADRQVHAIVAASDGAMWIGTRQGGMARWDGRSLRKFGPADGLTGNGVRDIVESRSGGFWIAAADGLFRLKDGRFQGFTTRDGLSHNFTYALLEDPDGTLWIGTYGGGLCRYRQGRFESFRRADGLYDDTVFSLAADGAGRLWMTCNRGLFAVKRRELEEFASGRRKTFTSESYTQNDGMPASECNGTAHPSSLYAPDGSLWVPTLAGVAVFDLGHVRRNHLPPPVIVESVAADGRTYRAGGPVVAPPGEGKLQIRYTGLSFLAPERMRFRYKLDGFDRDWVDAGTRREAFYTNLPPGAYAFRVQACNNDGVWNYRGTTVPIRLSPHYYQTSWFLAACLLGVFGIAGGGYRLRIASLRNRERELLKRVREQTDIIRRTLEAEAGLENRFRELVENASDAIFSQEHGGLFLSMNEAGRQMTGYSLAELRTMGLGGLVAPGERARLEVWMRGLTRQSSPALEFEITAKSGERRIWEVKAHLRSRPEGGPLVEGVARDITEHRRSEELRRAKQAAEEANRAKSNFLANMSHELRTPLNAVIGYSEMIQEDAEAAGHTCYLPDLERIRAAGRQLLGLINDVLDLSKIEAGFLKMHLEECEVAAFLHELRCTAEPLARRNRNRLIFASNDAPETVVADRVRFRQSLLNLLSNACKFTEDGTITLSVERRERDSTRWVCWTVGDTGIGIAAEDIGRIFRMFTQVDASATRRYGGTGLGLAISKEFCTRMGGQITVESKLGEGSAFTVWLPERKDPDGAPNPPPDSL